MANDDRLGAHVHGSGGGSLSDCSGILVVCVDEEFFAHTAAEAAWDFSQFEIFHESEIDELSLVLSTAVDSCPVDSPANALSGHPPVSNGDTAMTQHVLEVAGAALVVNAKMAEFGDNPFADPQDVNPFADPSVQEVQTEPQKEEEYNPFAEQETKPDDTVPILPPPPTAQEVKSQNLLEKKKKKVKVEKPPGPARPPSEPAVIQPTVYEPPPYSYSTPEEEELRRKEEELAARERALQQREQLRDPRPNNFPPLPKWFPIKPCFYHNISDEVPEGQRWIMRGLLILWAVYCGALLMNCIILLLGLFVWTTSAALNLQYFGTSFAFSIIYLLLYPLLSLVCWYMPIYRAFRKDSSLSFMWFFLMFGLQIACWILNGVGFINLGAAGLWLGATALQGSTDKTQQNNVIYGEVVGVAMLLFTAVWFVLAVVGIVLFVMTHRYYRRSGYTLEQAQQEALKAAASNKTVRSAAKQAVVTGVKAASSSQ